MNFNDVATLNNDWIHSHFDDLKRYANITASLAAW